MNENDINLRDYFAGRDAVQADMEREEMAAVQAYMAADAMMAARKD